MPRNPIPGAILLLTLAPPALVSAFAAPETTQVPAPFPRPGQPASPRPDPPSGAVPQTAPPPATAAPAQPGDPTEATLGAPLHPSAQFLESYDAGRGQRFYIYGSQADFLQVVTFYKTMLKQRGDMVFEEPPVQMFELGRFREETMGFPPSLTVKDYTWGGSKGYLGPTKEGGPTRFRTIIQIVPAPPAAPRQP